MNDLIRGWNWSETPLGPTERWPEVLRSTLGLCLDSAFPIAIYWGPELALLYNDAWRPILGNKHPRALGRPAVKVWPEIWDAIEPVFQRVRETRVGAFNGDSLLAMHRHGYVEECYFDYTFNPIRDGAGGVAGIFNVVIETTYRVINERRGKVLREFAAHLAAARSADDVIALAAQALEAAPFDVPCALIYRVDGAEPGAVRLAQSVRVAAPAAFSATTWPIAAALRDGAPQRVADLQTRVGAFSGGAWAEAPREALVLPIHAPGRPAPDAVLVAIASPRRALDAEYTAFFESLARHMAAAIASAEAFEAARRRAEALAELDRAKTVFFSNVSHELRTPLALILAPLNDLLAAGHGTLSAGVQESLQLARRNAERLRKLVNNLLEFSRLEAGRVAVRYEQTDLARLTEDLASNFRSACERAGLALRVECPPLPEPVLVDRDMWERVVLNLLSNAFKFTLQGEIFVGLEQAGGRAVLTVRDTGTGIPAEELPRLFERFRRIENAHARSQEGTGIGLALVNELVKLHGGEVVVESAVGRGTQIEVAIPLDRTTLPADTVAGERRPAEGARTARFVEEALSWLGDEPHGAAPPSRDATAAPRQTVLVADDNADMRAYLARLLGDSYDVIVVARGDEALEVAHRARPDLVLSDVMMPGLDGFALLRALRHDERTRTVPVILLSARAGEEARVEGLEAGADDYLVKPFDSRELVARVGGAIALATQRRDADRRKDEFLATLAHELRNPLAPIRMAAEVLKRAPDAKAEEYARGVIERQVDNMSRLIDDLMDLSRISRGKIELRMETMDLQSVLQEAIEATQPLLAGANQLLSVHLPSQPIRIRCDRVRLTQVFTNLLNNASKYSNAGARISIDASLDDNDAVVSVTDEGVGIDAAMLPKVWDMFVQAHRSMERSHGGLGIGLTIVRSLVEMQGGSVNASSPGPDRGATFTVRLPLHADVRDSRQTPAQAARVSPASARVLVADDNEDAAAMLGAYLETMGCVVAVAHDGRAALELAQRFRPDVAVLDLGMPRLNGLECARELRSESWGRAVKLVALTGWGQEEDRKRSKEAGFDHHLVKPVNPDIVAALIAQQAGSRARQE
ncbi:MAG TPA: ATP-binding protein [Gammaproteobacteria bacterium]|nr:ATP-binding protein [Gammaproteobacteria bacterium]